MLHLDLQPNSFPPQRCPAHQTLGDVDVQDPQPDGDHNPEPVEVTLMFTCVVLAEPRRAPENRGPKFTLRNAGGGESNLKVKKKEHRRRDGDLLLPRAREDLLQRPGVYGMLGTFSFWWDVFLTSYTKSPSRCSKRPLDPLETPCACGTERNRSPERRWIWLLASGGGQT
jgi:hypothetical protein